MRVQHSTLVTIFTYVQITGQTILVYFNKKTFKNYKPFLCFLLYFKDNIYLFNNV